MTEALSLFRRRIAEAIGGREQASEFERRTCGAFTRMTLQRWIDGKTFPDIAELQALAEIVGAPLGWFLGLEPARAPPNAAAILVPALDVTAAAGEGGHVDVVRGEAEFAFPTYFLERLLGEASTRARVTSLRAKGRSMEPTILDGALLILDEAQRELPPPPSSQKARRMEPEIFVFFTPAGLRLKRLKRIDEDFVAIISDNAAEHPIELFRLGRDGKITVIGKVIWWDNRL